MSTITGSAPRMTIELAAKTPPPLGSAARVGTRNVSGAMRWASVGRVCGSMATAFRLYRIQLDWIRLD